MRRLQSIEDRSESAEVNLSPLIDVVFLLLIFFMVTTVFVEESGVDIDQPTATTASSVDRRSIQIAVTAEEKIVFDHQPVTLNNLQGLIVRLRASERRPVLLRVDRGCSTGYLMDVYDECRRAAGPDQVKVATELEGL